MHKILQRSIISWTNYILYHLFSQKKYYIIYHFDSRRITSTTLFVFILNHIMHMHMHVSFYYFVFYSFLYIEPYNTHVYACFSLLLKVFHYLQNLFFSPFTYKTTVRENMKYLSIDIWAYLKIYFVLTSLNK